VFTAPYGLNVQRSSVRLISISLPMLHTHSTVLASSLYCQTAKCNITNLRLALQPEAEHSAAISYHRL